MQIDKQFQEKILCVYQICDMKRFTEMLTKNRNQGKATVYSIHEK